MTSVKMRKNETTKEEFILVYSDLIMSVLVITAGIIANTILKEVSIARDEGESLKAFYAADTGIECVRYLQNKYRAFNPTTQQDIYNCGVGSDFPAGGNPVTAECEAHSYAFTLDDFANDSCTSITVDIVPRTIVINGNPTIVCDADVVSRGRNICSGSAPKVVERTRWERM